MRLTLALKAGYCRTSRAAAKVAYTLVLRNIGRASLNVAVSTLCVIKFWFLGRKISSCALAEEVANIFEWNLLLTASWGVEALIDQRLIENLVEAAVAIVVLAVSFVCVAVWHFAGTADALNVGYNRFFVAGWRTHGWSFLHLYIAASILVNLKASDRGVVARLLLGKMPGILVIRAQRGVCGECLQIFQLQSGNSLRGLIAEVVQRSGKHHISALTRSPDTIHPSYKSTLNKNDEPSILNRNLAHTLEKSAQKSCNSSFLITFLCVF